MNWRDIYKQKLTTAEEAVKVIKSGDRVVPGHAASESEYLVDHMVRRYKELENVTIVEGVSLGSSPYCKPEMEGHFVLNSMFLGPHTRQAVWEKRGDFLPLNFHQFPRAFREGLIPIDVFLTMVSPPDKFGYCSLGISVDHSKQLIESAKIVIAEVNPNMPRTYGESLVHVSKFDYFVENDWPLLELQRFASKDRVTDAIGRNVASLINDGDTLQMGAGTVPDALLYYLKEKNDLGIHTEMFSDGIIELIESGIINGKKKTLWPEKIVATFCEGTKKIYDFVHENPVFQFMPVDYVNDPRTIAQNDNMVAINQAMEIDLLGQVASESIATKQYSGIGGQLDFIRGSAMAHNGRPVIVLPSTAKNGTISRIKCQMNPGTPLSDTRNDVHYVVTEYGVANLFCKTNTERARELIEIAHPDFRSELIRQYKDIYGRVL
ncbi:MAG: acetyl-CoA hydrolase/transferase family protein [Syntrophomonadaceae bacterium]|jgi:4-hydroxybutyrate CoA-transferase|nr:acetyl-CoA hydrolase/transferase family protein [Syntrophomonadaceae bacterium]